MLGAEKVEVEVEGEQPTKPGILTDIFGYFDDLKRLDEQELGLILQELRKIRSIKQRMRGGGNCSSDRNSQ